MKRKLVAVLTLCSILPVAYFAFVKWGIRHETLSLHDTVRDRDVAVDVSVRWDSEMKADAGLTPLPVAIVSHGNTVEHDEYSFLVEVLAARGYLVVSVDHDVPDDAPLVTQPGVLYVGRLPVYERGVENIQYALGQLRRFEPNADYEHLTMVGHSNGGDISVFFAITHPELVKKLVTLDNLRVPLPTSGRAEVLSFRSKDWKPDAGVIPDEELCRKVGIRLIWTDAQHVQMSDRGPAQVKEHIQKVLDDFLDEP